MADSYHSDSDPEEEEVGAGQPFSLDLPIDSRERDQDYYIQSLGGIAYEKVLTTKCKTFDVLTRADTTIHQNIQTVVSETFRPELAQESAYPYLNVFKNMFRREHFLEFEDKMFSSTIVGWTSETNTNLLVNPTHLGDMLEYGVPMSDTLFPVLVSGKEHSPVTPFVFDRDIFDYEPGIYLVLFDYPGLGSATVQIDVYKQRSQRKFTVHTYRAELEVYFVNFLWDHKQQTYLKNYYLFAKIDRIVDKDNAVYGVFGMYAGGPLPKVRPYASGRPGKHRICWDQPRNLDSQDYGLRSMAAGFRWDIDYQKGSRRVGYYCSRDAILAVRETKILEERGPFNYRSLLKEYTFVIVDGFSTFWLFYGEGETQQNIPFKDLDDTTLGPIIVIIPEGVSCLAIIENEDFPNYRNSMYYNENQTQPPIVINWKTFQKDFNIEEQLDVRQSFDTQFTGQPMEPTFTGLQQIMRFEEFPDSVVFPIPSMQRQYLFSLKQAPNYFPKQNRYDEYWNVYSLVSPQSNLYYYLGTISNSFYPTNGFLSYVRTHFQHSMFPIDINPTKYPSITEEERQTALRMAKEWRTVTKNKEFKEILRALVRVSVNHLNNVTVNAHSRQRRLESLSVNVPE